MKLDRSFYLQPDVVSLARQLLGKVLVSNFNNIVTSGIITETEAYAGAEDRASHAYGNRRTSRTEIMFRQGGTAYVYLCYGMYSLFNVVTNKKDIPHAVLVRAVKPIDGVDTMLKRINKNNPDKILLNGPGKLTKAMGINYKHTGLDLLGRTIWIEDRQIKAEEGFISALPRIGIDYAGEDARLPYRFILNKYY